MTVILQVRSTLVALLLATFALQLHAAQPPHAMPTSISRYVFIPASTFVPLNSITTYQYIDGGCVSAPQGADLAHKLVLPQGSVLHYVRSFYKDESVYALSVSVSRYDGNGAFAEVGNVDSVDGSGYTSSLSGDMNHTVDAFNQAYVVNAKIDDNGETIFKDGFDGSHDSLVFCGARVQYSQ